MKEGVAGEGRRKLEGTDLAWNAARWKNGSPVLLLASECSLMCPVS